MPLRSEMKRAVSGRICISPYAPCDDSTSSSKLLSVRITAAVRAGSTPCSTEADLMVSSCSRGCVNRRKASSRRGSRSSARRTSAKTTSRIVPRPRRGGRPCLLRFSGSSFAAAIPPTEHPIHEIPRLLFESIYIAVVLHHHVCPSGLLCAGELARFYRAALLLPHAPLLRPLLTPLFRGHHGDGDIEPRATPTLEEERYLGHEEIRIRSRGAPVRLLAHPWVQDLLEIPQRLHVTEDLLTQRLAVYAPLAAHVFSVPFHHGGYGLLILGEEVVYDFVGGKGLSTQTPENLYEGALAGSQRAGDAYRHRPLFGLPLWRVSSYLFSRSRSLSLSKTPLRRPSPTRSPRSRSLSRSRSRSLSREPRGSS